MDALTLAGFFLGGFVVAVLPAVGAIKLLVDLHKDERQATAAEREQWRSERRELLNRLQHPNLVPTGTERPQRRQHDPEVTRRVREWAHVGQVTPGVLTADEPDLP